MHPLLRVAVSCPVNGTAVKFYPAPIREEQMSLRELRPALSLGLLAFAACSDTPTPTQPPAAEPVTAAALNAVVSNPWTTKAAYPSLFGANGPSAGVLPNAAGQDLVYALGGTDNEGGSGVSVKVYNPATNTWTQKSYEPRVYVFATNGVGRIGSVLYFSGGSYYSGGFEAYSPELWAYNAATNRLVQKASMPKAATDGVTGVISGKLYVL